MCVISLSYLPTGVSGGRIHLSLSSTPIPHTSGTEISVTEVQSSGGGRTGGAAGGAASPPPPPILSTPPLDNPPGPGVCEAGEDNMSVG